MNKKIALISFIALFTVISAFAATCPVKIIASCTTFNSGNLYCEDYLNQTVPLIEYQQYCNSDPHNTFSQSPCSAANLSGSCKISYEQQDATVMRFYAPFPADHVAVVCAQAEGGEVCE